MTSFADLPIRDDLRGQQPYGAPQVDAAVRLNTNENPYPPSAALVRDLVTAVTAAAGGLNRYPDREARQLRAALARYLDHDAEGVWAANGSNEVIQQLCQAFGGPGRTALGFEPSYSMHRLIALATGTPWVAAERAADFTLSVGAAVAAVEQHQPDLVFLCTPNNPTATPLDHDVIAAVAAVAPGMVVVDEAYAEFSSQVSATALLEGRPRLVVTRTMSKAFAMAGTRVGYLAADPAVVDALRLVRLPYHLSAITQAAACAALAHAEDTLATVELVKAERERLRTALVDLGVEVAISDANFLLFGRFDDPAKVWQGVLDKGVLIRDVSAAVPGWLRVTVGVPEEDDAFVAALATVLEGMR